MTENECHPCFGDIFRGGDCVLPRVALVSAHGYDLQDEPVDEDADAADEGAEVATCVGKRCK